MKSVPVARLRLPLAVATAAVVLGSGAATAASQGILVTGGGPSSGSIGVGIDKIFSVRISSLEDIEFGEHAYTDTGFSSDESFCVYSSTGTFDLTMESGNVGGGTVGGAVGDTVGGAIGDTVGGTVDGLSGATPEAMRMAGSAENAFMAYTITLDGDAAPLQSGTARTGLTGDRASETCGGTDNVDFTVAIDANTFNDAPPGAYSDVLTMFVAPR